jgi:hypothetical protein
MIMRLVVYVTNYISALCLGFWYVSVGLEEDVTTTIASSTATRTAFVAGNGLPPDDMVTLVSLNLK